MRKYVENDTKLKEQTKTEVIAVIDANINIGTKKWRMTKLPVYKYLYTTYYPLIRNSMFCILYFNELPEPPVIKPEPPVIEPEPPVIEPEPEVKEPEHLPEVPQIPVPSASYEPWPIAIKSNLLYDLATALNVEVEIPIGVKWSIMFEDVFPWWHNGNKWAFQMWEMGVEGRYWFMRTPARKTLTGHFVGLYVM